MDQSVVAQLVEVFSKTNDPNTAVQQQVQQFIASCSKDAQYLKYVTHVFSLKNIAPDVRRIAGLQVKNSIVSHYASSSKETIIQVRDAAFQAIEETNLPFLQKTASLIITSLAQVDVQNAPEILQILIQKTSSNIESIANAAFQAISILCEDSAASLSKSSPDFVAQIIPFFISNFNNPSGSIRSHAISTANHFLLNRSPAFHQHIQSYYVALCQRASSDSDKNVIKQVCKGFVMVLEYSPNLITSELSSIIQFMLKCTESGDEIVALEACEFWLAIAEQEQMMDMLEPFLKELIRVLLKGMVYSENDLFAMGPDVEDSHVADRIEDIKPRFHKSKSHATDLTDEQKKALKKGSEDDDDDDFDDEEDDEDLNEWNLRKCSAAALDLLSNVYMDAILEPLLPMLKEHLTHQDWRIKEAGILALGAIAEGCIRGIEPHLNELINYLVRLLTDPKPLVRSITCWTLSRFSHWIIFGPEFDDTPPNHAANFFHPVLQGLLHMVLDNSKRVQEAGCSALATVEEEAEEQLVPFIPHIIHTLTLAFGKYQHKNLMILYDAVGTLADSVGSELNKPEYAQALLAPLIEKWKLIADDDRDIFPLLECLASIAVALGPGFKEVSPHIWERCMRIIQSTFQRKIAQEQAAVQNNLHSEEVDIDFVVVALDLLSGIAQGLGSQVNELVSTSNPNLVELVEYCMKEKDVDVRQSAYALLGDLIISSFGFVKPRLNTLVPLMLTQITRNQIELGETSVCNNATWAMGELSLQLGAEIQPFCHLVIPVLITILNSSDASYRMRTLHENAAITLGRFGLVCTSEVAPHVDKFINGWCSSLRDTADNLEKETAFRGMCKIANANPQGVISNLAFFCDAISRWERPSTILNSEFLQTLVMFKNGLGNNWDVIYKNFPMTAQERLKSRYNI